MNQISKSFAYRLLDEETRIIVGQRTLEIKNLMRLTAENIISIGQKLTEVKEKLEHGTFQTWLRTEFEWSEQTARQFMQVYRWSETIKNKNFVFSQLGTSALYLLAAPSTPPEARQEILGLVEEGEKIAYTRAKAIVDRHKHAALTTVEERSNVQKTVDTVAQVNSTGKLASSSLFRLKTEDLGCIVRLYQAEELESTTELTVGTKVKIKIGRWQGQTATIAEIMTESPFLEVESTEIVENSSQSKTSVIVNIINPADEELLAEEHLLIHYGNVCLAAEGNPNALSAFIEQLQTNTVFVQQIFEQAMNYTQSY